MIPLMILFILLSASINMLMGSASAKWAILAPKEKRRPFKYFDKGGLATIGKNRAVGFYKGIHLTGLFAWLAWGFIHIFYLVSYRSQFAVMLDWVFHYMTGLRGARLIHKTIDDEMQPPKGK